MENFKQIMIMSIIYHLNLVNSMDSMSARFNSISHTSDFLPAL